LSRINSTVFRENLESEQALLAGLDPEHVLEHIQGCIDRNDPILKVLRLLCLYSLTNNGLKEKPYNFLKREILQTYGYKYLFVMDKLAKLGMFISNTSRLNPWQQLSHSLKLIIEEIDEQNPVDLAYVYSGYAPITCRLIEIALKMRLPFLPCSEQKVGKEISTQEPTIIPGWNKIDDEIIEKVPGGQAFHAVQKLTQGCLVNEDKINQSRVTLVLFVGGCTFTEISAIRFLNKKNPNEHIIVATTKLINGNTIIESLYENDL